MFKLRARKRLVGSLLAIGALTLGTVVAPTTAPAAEAAVPCPVNPGPAGIDGWVADFASHGVTLCIGYDGEVQRAMVQIIDLAAGAKLTVASGPAVLPLPPNPADNRFPRRTMSQWESIQGLQAPASGDPYRAFSVTNASFFTDTSSADTKLSLPFRFATHGDRGRSHGVAIYNNDPGSSVGKRVLRMASPGVNVEIDLFPTIYNSSDAQCTGWYYCVVGYDPRTDLSGNGNTATFRTYVGTNASFGQTATRAYILTGGNLTVAEADSIMDHFGAWSRMQLDGGGSTAMRSYMSDFGGALGRAVPTALVVKYSPTP